MRAIGILWNSMEAFVDDAIIDIQKYAIINDIISIDFGEKFPEFLSVIYPYSGPELWKLEYKIANMNCRFSSNEIKILFLEIEPGKKIFSERKEIYLYENIEVLKKFIRSKYSKLVSHYAFDNIYHMTDDELEYEMTMKIIINYIYNYFSGKHEIINLDNMLGYPKKFVDKTLYTGKRNKFTICDNRLIYKQEKDETFESYAEVFCYNLFNFLGILSSKCSLSCYQGKTGILYENFIHANEILIDGTHLIDTYLNYIENNTVELKNEINHKIEEIIRYNNCEDIINIIAIIKEKSNFDFSTIISELKKMYAIDLLLLQSDRNPSNWGILYNVKTNNVKFAPLYDNSHIFGLNKTENINKLFNSINDHIAFNSLLYADSVTLFRVNHNDDLFLPKQFLINELDDSEILKWLQSFMDKIESIGTENLVETIVNNMPDKVKDLQKFKKIISNALKINIKNINNSFEKKKKLIYY